MLLVFSIIKALSEVLALALLGQGLLWVLAGASRETNFVYRMFVAITKPIMQISRILMPRFVLDRHLWMVAIGLLVVIWIVAGQQKLNLCLRNHPDDPLCAELVQAVKQRAEQKGAAQK